MFKNATGYCDSITRGIINVSLLHQGLLEYPTLTLKCKYT